MIALDAGIVARYLVRDDPGEAERARSLLEGLTAQQPGFLSRHTVVDLVQELERVHGLPRPTIANVLVELAATDGLVIESVDDVLWSAHEYRAGAAEFDDLVMIATARRAGAAPFYTLDPDFARLDGVELVEPQPEVSEPPEPHTLKPDDGEQPADEAADLVAEAESRAEGDRRAREAAEARAEAERTQRETAEAKAQSEHRLREDAEARATDLQRALDQVQRNFSEINSAVLANGVPPALDVEEPPPADVVGAVKLAQLSFPDRLTFLREAMESAEDSLYQNPANVYRAFAALADLAEVRAAGSLGKRVQDWLADRGLNYAAHESQTTMGKYGEERTYRYAGAKFTMKEHIKFGVGPDPRTHLRIHLAWHEGEQRWLIGHVGRHLTNTKTS